MTEKQLKILNRNVMIELIGDEPEMIRQFEIDFLKQAKVSLRNIVTMYNDSRILEIKEEAHFLKTSAKAVGAEQTSYLLQALEQSGLEQDKAKCKDLILRVKEALQRVHGVIVNDKTISPSMP
ncbi:Hpt protein [Shewanella sediminis HAW-EB3]|uniref:Hpt protein n=1 Tax=Shewanella sediminis (strain HAW-EB3) TaxID=425104 RepID=A8FRX4_SHESH|nr:Hpt domain-containing protein [Shewanella sediminis]ABV35597.1 Hpt protein [Shewanella sediminis HAW-EB3]